MKKDKIYELRIDEEDEISGIDSISLVDEPAIEVNWVAFNKHKHSATEECFNIPDGEDSKYLEMLYGKGNPEQELLDDGYELVSIEVNGERSFLSTKPNAPSEWNEGDYLVRYKYILDPRIKQAPIIPTTRDFCSDLLNKNFVWRIEDMDSLQNDFGQSAMVWRGGFNCRHRWAKLFYKKDATIVNKGSSTEGRVKTEDYGEILGYPQPNTITNKTEANPSPSTRKNLGLSKQGFEVGVPHYTKDGKLYEGPTHKDASGRLMTGAVHTKDSEYLYHAGELMIVCKECGHKWNMEDGGDKPYMCNKCGYDNFGYDNSLPSYVDQVSGQTIEKSIQKFQTDEEKKMVVGPAMVPDLNIFRKDIFGNPYYVYFSADTIKMIAEKYMKNKYIDNNDENHNGKAVSDVYVVESWIKEDKEDKSNKYGYGDLPIGTWFVSMKIKNEEVWNKVKNGELKGFSVSGYFEEIAEFAKEQMFLQEVVKILNKYE